MEYQKIAHLLNDESNKPSIFRTKNWVEINDDIQVHTLLITVITVMHIYFLKKI